MDSCLSLSTKLIIAQTKGTYLVSTLFFLSLNFIFSTFLLFNNFYNFLIVTIILPLITISYVLWSS